MENPYGKWDDFGGSFPIIFGSTASYVAKSLHSKSSPARSGGSCGNAGCPACQTSQADEHISVTKIDL